MPRLIIIEKPSFLCRLDEEALLPADADVVCTLSIGLWGASLPKTLTFADIPCLPAPVFDRPSVLVSGGKMLLRDHAGGEPICASEDGAGHARLVKLLNDRLRNYSEIVVATDADHTGYWGAKQILDRLVNHPLPPVRVCRAVAWDSRNLQEAFMPANQLDWHTDPLIRQLIDYAQAKRTFDYWWTSNSLLVCGELLKRCELDAATPVGKHELLVLSWLASAGPKSMGAIFSRMERWRGTGAHDKSAGEVGSPMSRANIVKALVVRGALTDVDGLIQVTERGQRLLASLHPRTVDVDLPFRLEAWFSAGDRDRMARYIRTVFGRQLKYQRQPSNPRSEPSSPSP